MHSLMRIPVARMRRRAFHLQGVGKTELFLQLLVFLKRKRFGEIVVGGRKILTTNEVGRYRMPLVG